MNKTTWFLLAFAVILIVLAVVIGRSGQAPQADVRNRVPTIPQSTAEAIKAAQDAQAAAQAAQQAQRDIQAQLAQLADDNKKEQEAAKAKASGPAAPYGKEITNPGIVTDFGAFPLIADNATDDVYLGFTFTDRTGFTKKFFPVCTHQGVKTGTPITIIYHWREWTANTAGKRGCYEIDGFQQ
jgi:hypothetical protein